MFPQTKSDAFLFSAKRLLRMSQALLLVVILTGCSTINSVTGRDDTTRLSGQSETDAATSFRGGVHRIVVAFNDETGNQGKIQYDQFTRKVLRGASLMGWSYSEDHGKTWKYGGKVKPPSGWAVLWGDPAITSSRANYGMVFISNLAFPDSKFPVGGVEGRVDIAFGGYSVIGGACIARSTDGGVNFQNFQCVSNTDPIPGIPVTAKGHFYDGGSMASSPQGEIFASFVDVDASQIDIWRSPDGNQPFSRLPPPFPNYYVGSHPRVRVGPDGTLFVMGIIKQGSSDSKTPYILAMNRYRDGKWSVPTFVESNVAVYPNIPFGNSVLGSPLAMRTGPQFSFDIGTSSFDRDDSIRLLYTKMNQESWYFVRGGICDYNLKSCGWYENWTFGASSVRPEDSQRLDVFNPNVAAFPAFIGISPRWQGSFLTRYGNSTTTLNLTRATLGYANGVPLSIPVDIARDAPVCSDQRGYWGDYDGFLPVEVDGDSIRFMRFMTDSSGGCTKRWQFIGESQHVRAVDYWY